VVEIARCAKTSIAKITAPGREGLPNDGAVDTSTTPSVQYTYADGATDGVAAYLRLTDIIYPNGRDVVYGYGDSGSTDDVLSRVESIGDGTVNYAVYKYLGANQIVSEDYQQPQVELDYTADNFAALDRFSRVTDQVWSSYGDDPGTLDEYTYTYDRAGNVTTRDNTLDSALSQTYEYNGLNELTSAERGDSSTQTWDLDALGNWSSFDNNGSTQTRTTDAANEIASTSGIATPEYDLAGNMVSTPNPNDESSSLTLTYDAWDRLVSASDGTTTDTYQYDGVGRLTERVVSGTTEHFYYSGQQVVETRLPSESGLQPEYQYVWSLQYVDSPILRDTYSGGELQSSERLYYLTDANHNVTAVVNSSGVVQERYDYDPFGKVTIYNASWSSPTTTSSVGNTRFFAGQELDPLTGLQYSRARWYSASIGGFLSRDPTGFAAGDVNLHRYVNSNPIIFVDPSGLSARGALIAGGTGLATGAATGALIAGPAGAVAGGILGGIGGLIAGALSSPKASLGELLAAGAAAGLAGGLGGGAAVEALEAAGILGDAAGALGVAGEAGEALAEGAGLAGVEGIADTGLAGAEGSAAEGSIWSAISNLLSDDLGALDLNKLNHIFGNLAHNLGGLVNSLGSEEAAFNGIQSAAENAVAKNSITGLFEETVTVAGEQITVRGNVINGVVKIGTAFK
jgi:RHS repeat-associated protein